MKQFNLLGTKGRKINVSFKSTLRLFVMVVMLLATALQVNAQSMYVATKNNVSTFYYDDEYPNRHGTTIDFSHKCDISATIAVFDASFAAARPTSTCQWFYNCRNLKEIRGLENLNTSEVRYVTNVSWLQ